MARWIESHYRFVGREVPTKEDAEALVGTNWCIWPLPAIALLSLAIFAGSLVVSDGWLRAFGIPPAIGVWWFLIGEDAWRTWRDRRGLLVDVYVRDGDAALVDRMSPLDEIYLDDDLVEQWPSATRLRVWPRSLRSVVRLSDDPTIGVTSETRGEERLSPEEIAEVRAICTGVGGRVWGATLAWWSAIPIPGLLLGGHPLAAPCTVAILGVGAVVLGTAGNAAYERRQRRDRILKDPTLVRDGMTFLANGVPWRHGEVPAAWRRRSFLTDVVLPLPHGDGI